MTLAADIRLAAPPRSRPRAGAVLWGLGAVLSVGVALFSYRYLAQVGPRIPELLNNAFAKPWLYVHIAGAATALLIASFQFLPALRRLGRPWHRWLGRAYVVGCLVGAAGGFITAFGSFAGPVATGGFATLAVLWAVANVQGWRTAQQRRFEEHRRWMIRSFAMTFAAVTLRLDLALLPLLHAPFLEGYRAISWICWVGNLVVAEIYLRRNVKPRAA